MNWTGGNLQRHSRKSGHNATIEKQKQHFAKSRTRLQNGNAARPAIFGEDLEDEHTFQQPVLQQPTPARRQSKLEGFTDFAPVIDRLGSMTSKRPRVHDSRSRSSKLPSSQKLQSVSHEPQSEPSQPRDEDPRFKRPRIDQGLGLSASEKLERQRQLLLGKSDWVGLQTANTLHHDFVSDRGKDNFGKRRRVDKEVSHRQHNPDHAQRVYVSSVRDFPRRRDDQPIPDGTLSDSIQIKIGNDALTSRLSVSQYAETARESPLQVASSDSMLRDEDDDLQDPAQHSLFLNFKRGRQKLHHAQSESPLGHLQGQARDSFVEATDEDYEIATDIGSGHHAGSNAALSPPGHKQPEETRSPHVSESAFGSMESPHQRGHHSPARVFQKQGPLRKLARDKPHEEAESDMQEEVNKEHDFQTSHLKNEHAWQHFIKTTAVGDGEETSEDVLLPILRKRAQLIPSPQPPLPSLFSNPQIHVAPIAVRTTNKSDAAPVPPTPASLKALDALCQARPPQAAATEPDSITPTPNSLKALKTLCQAPAPQAKAAGKKLKPVSDPDAAWKAFVFGHKAPVTAEPALPGLDVLAPANRPVLNSSNHANPPTPRHHQRNRSSSFLTSIGSSSSHADACTTAAMHAPSSSAALQSDSGVVSPLQTHRSASQASFDRPSSVANASIMPAVLRTNEQRPMQRISSPDPLQAESSPDPLTVGHTQGRQRLRMVFSKPKPFGRSVDDGNVETRDADRSTKEHVVYIGQGRGRRARARAQDADNEADEMDMIEDD